MAHPFAHLDPADYPLPADLRARLAGPCLVVWLDRVRSNVAEIVRLIGGDLGRWRPHVKTTKIKPVFAELARAGIGQFKCATVREARALLEVLREEAGGGDVLLAHPLLGPGLGRLGELARAHPEARVSVLCEDPARVADVPGELGIFVDVDPGMRRTGIPLDERDAILAVARRAGPRFRGVHYYDGHLHDADAGARRERIWAGYAEVLDLAAELGAGGAPVAELVTSGTPAFTAALAYEPFAALRGDAPLIQRISPGTVVYHDLRSALENPDLAGLAPAALVFSRIVSHPGGGRVTCDAGSKSIAAEAGDPCAVALGYPGLEALPPSEEHLPFEVRGGARPARATELLLAPRHVCPTVNLAAEAVLMDGERFVGAVPVDARAHDALA